MPGQRTQAGEDSEDLTLAEARKVYEIRNLLPKSRSREPSKWCGNWWQIANGFKRRLSG